MVKQADALKRLRRARSAILPIANLVFNDNGDMTVSGSLGYDATILAYYALKRIDAALDGLKGR